MKPRKILRRKEAMARLGCGHTKFHDDYVHREGGDENDPGTSVPRVRPLHLGPRNVGFLEHELDALIDALAKSGGHTESKAKNMKAARGAKVGTRTTVFLTDAKMPQGLEQKNEREEKQPRPLPARRGEDEN
jgi:predicted DNA-binding transcriptional regulator AlpA